MIVIELLSIYYGSSILAILESNAQFILTLQPPGFLLTSSNFDYYPDLFFSYFLSCLRRWRSQSEEETIFEPNMSRTCDGGFIALGWKVGIIIWHWWEQIALGAVIDTASIGKKGWKFRSTLRTFRNTTPIANLVFLISNSMRCWGTSKSWIRARYNLRSTQPSLSLKFFI